MDPVSTPNEGTLPPSARGREAEWGRRFAALTLAWLAAETITGLGLWLLPFSVPAQWTVVVHTALGLLFLAPVLVYLFQHFVAYRTRPQGALVWMGYLATAATLVGNLLADIAQVVIDPRVTFASREAARSSQGAVAADGTRALLWALVRHAAAAPAARRAVRAVAAQSTRRGRLS